MNFTSLFVLLSTAQAFKEPPKVQVCNIALCSKCTKLMYYPSKWCQTDLSRTSIKNSLGADLKITSVTSYKIQRICSIVLARRSCCSGMQKNTSIFWIYTDHRHQQMVTYWTTDLYQSPIIARQKHINPLLTQLSPQCCVHPPMPVSRLCHHNRYDTCFHSALDTSNKLLKLHCKKFEKRFFFNIVVNIH